MTSAVRTEYDNLYFGGAWLPAATSERPEVVWSPFGGYKQSGIGREYGPVGLEGYLEYKSIYGAPQAS